MGPPTDPGPSGSARVSKWSVRPCRQFILYLHFSVKVGHIRTQSLSYTRVSVVLVRKLCNLPLVV
ncbi:unnamed protein product, partial [Staurois parvus]